MRLRVAAIGLWIVAAACHAAPAHVSAAAVVAPDDAVPVAAVEPAPAMIDAGAPDVVAPAAVATPRFETWRAGDFDVVTSLPLGVTAEAHERRPVVVGIHGSHDRPEATCARWRRALAGYPFIVCPEGVPYRGGLAWGAAGGIAERVDRALAGVRERHGSEIAAGPVMYAGWSLGATRGPAVVGIRPGTFDVVVLAEIGHTKLDAASSAKSLQAGKATHTLVACATKKCANFAKRMKAAPGLVFVDGGIGRGHLFDDQMGAAIGRAVAESVAGDPRWSGLKAALASGLPNDELVPPPTDDEPDLVPPE